MKNLFKLGNNHFQKSMIALIIGIFATAVMSGQSKATFDDTNGFQITTVDNMDLFDIRVPLNANVKLANVEFLAQYNSPLSTVTKDEKTKTVHILLEKRMKPDWTVADWNAYLKQLHTKKTIN